MRRKSPTVHKPVSTVKLKRMAPWSTAGVFFGVSLVLALVACAAAFFLFLALTEIGILSELDAKIASVAGEEAFKLSEVVTLSKFMGITAVVAALFVGLSPLMGLCFAGFYNGVARLTGGITVEFAEAASAPVGEQL